MIHVKDGLLLMLLETTEPVELPALIPLDSESRNAISTSSWLDSLTSTAGSMTRPEARALDVPFKPTVEIGEIDQYSSASDVDVLMVRLLLAELKNVP